MAPTATSPPYFNSDELKHTEMMLSLACIIKSERPSARQGSIMSGLSTRFSFLIRRVVFLPNRNDRTHTQEHACEMMVARAAPAAPILSANMNTGSSTIFTTAPIRTDNIPVFAKPCAVMKVFMPRVNCTNSVPMAYMFM